MAALIALAVSVDAPPGRITDTLCTTDGLVSFWTADSRAEPHTGSVARFGFGGPELQMRVDQLDPGRRVAWTCLNDFPMPPGRWAGTTVTWDLTRGGSGVEVLLQHGNWADGIAQAELAGTAYTWALILTALKGYAETGTPQPVFTPPRTRRSSEMPSILFVHGAGHAAWCWHEHFTPWFEARGYTVAAPDLPGHGDLDRRGLKTTSLSAYVDAVAATACSLDPPLILAGHSMGGFIIQKHLESAQADLAILLASTPPAGAHGMVTRMATRRPLTFAKTMMTGNATDSPDRTRDYFFSPGTPAEVVNACHHRLQPESTRALKDMMAPLHPERVTTPVVVLGAEKDWLVAPPKDLTATARAYHTTPQTLPAGHDMMLDTAWEQAATAIQTAIAERHARR